MTISCSAYSCTNRWNSEKGISFHRFPLKDVELTMKWVIATRRRGFIPTKCSFICSIHFKETDFQIRPGAERRYLRSTAVPSQFSFPTHYLPSSKQHNRQLVRNFSENTESNEQVHFDDSQYEQKRADGKKLLKSSAIPTLFDVPKSQKAQSIKSASTRKRLPLQALQHAEGTSESSHKKTPNEGDALSQKSKAIRSRNIKIKVEDSQSEDGGVDELHELRPSAVTTNLNHGSTRTKTRKTFRSGSTQEPESSKTDQRNDALRTKVQPPLRGRKRGHPTKNQTTNVKDGCTSEKVQKRQAVTGSKRGRPVNSHSPLIALPPRKSARLAKGGRKKWAAPSRKVGKKKSNADEKFIPSKNSEQKNEVHCYVCNKLVEEGTPLRTRTTTTKVFMYQKLMKVVAAEFGEMVFDMEKEEEEEVLCSHCTRLLNYMDRIEVELNMLNKAILNCMRKKFSMGVTNNDKTQETAHSDLEEEPVYTSELEKPNFSHHSKDDEEGSIALDRQSVESDEVTHPEIEIVVDPKNNTDANNCEQSVEVKKSLPVEEFQCYVCMYRTVHKSVFVFHLRQHLKESSRCDFCNVSLPIDGVVDQVSVVDRVSESKDVSKTDCESWSEIKISKPHRTTPMEEFEQHVHNSGAVTSNITENETSDECDSPEPEMLKTAVPRSNQNEFTVLSDTGMSIVQKKKNKTNSLPLPQAVSVPHCSENISVTVPVVETNSSKSTIEECELRANINKDLTKHSRVDKLKEERDSTNVDVATPSECVVHSLKKEHLEQSSESSLNLSIKHEYS